VEVPLSSLGVPVPLTLGIRGFSLRRSENAHLTLGVQTKPFARVLKPLFEPLGLKLPNNLTFVSIKVKKIAKETERGAKAIAHGAQKTVKSVGKVFKRKGTRYPAILQLELPVSRSVQREFEVAIDQAAAKGLALERSSNPFCQESPSLLRQSLVHHSESIALLQATKTSMERIATHTETAIQMLDHLRNGMASLEAVAQRLHNAVQELESVVAPLAQNPVETSKRFRSKLPPAVFARLQLRISQTIR